MKILIIGGTGNISTAITKLLVSEGSHKIYLFHRSDTQIEGTISICGDRNDSKDMAEKISHLGTFDVVIDMIGYELDDAKNAISIFSGKTKQFIFCSTVDVFTKPAKRYPVIEADECKPDEIFPYAYKKAICEQLLTDAATSGAFKLTIIRPVATYNEASYPLALIGSGPHLLNRIKNGKPIIVMGDGSSFWVSCHRNDAALAFVNAIGNEKTYGKCYNLPGNDFMTWKTYFETVAEVMNAPKIKFICIPTDLLVKAAPKAAEWCGINFSYNNIFDNSLAKAELNFNPSITWKKGVKMMVDYHKKNGDLISDEIDDLYENIVEQFTLLSKQFAENVIPLDN